MSANRSARPPPRCVQLLTGLLDGQQRDPSSCSTPSLVLRHSA
ncbi:hypothetical protein V2I01_23400 [Micromonospora sp. BRA006-A]|nr:hypothetical protein [Micromonospora sp. BRA006-A]